MASRDVTRHAPAHNDGKHSHQGRRRCPEYKCVEDRPAKGQRTQDFDKVADAELRQGSNAEWLIVWQECSPNDRRQRNNDHDEGNGNYRGTCSVSPTAKPKDPRTKTPAGDGLVTMRARRHAVVKLQ